MELTEKQKQALTAGIILSFARLFIVGYYYFMQVKPHIATTQLQGRKCAVRLVDQDIHELLRRPVPREQIDQSVVGQRPRQAVGGEQVAVRQRPARHSQLTAMRRRAGQFPAYHSRPLIAIGNVFSKKLENFLYAVIGRLPATKIRKLISGTRVIPPSGAL